VVWPADRVSSYDLVEAADVVQVWSSTIGLESARLGVPVLKVFRGYASYPEGDFAQSAYTHDELINLMDDALSWRPNLDRLIKAWRFYGYSRFASSLDFRDVVPELQPSRLPKYRRPQRVEEIKRAVFDDSWPWTINRQAAGFLDRRLSPKDEAAAIRAQ